jgi:peroxiredoxin
VARLKSTTLNIGDPVPHLALHDVDGKPQTLYDVRAGGPALVIFAPGSWSPNTRRQVEGIRRAYDEFRERSIAVMLVVTESPRTARRLLSEDEPQFPVLIDEDREAARNFGVYRAFSLDGIGVTRPAAFLVDESGVLRFVYVGQGDRDVADVEELLHLSSWLVERNGYHTTEVAIPDEEALEIPATTEALALSETADSEVSAADEEEAPDASEAPIVAGEASTPAPADGTVAEEHAIDDLEVVATSADASSDELESQAQHPEVDGQGDLESQIDPDELQPTAVIAVSAVAEPAGAEESPSAGDEAPAGELETVPPAQTAGNR